MNKRDLFQVIISRKKQHKFQEINQFLTIKNDNDQDFKIISIYI